jgi:hypothetical protein
MTKKGLLYGQRLFLLVIRHVRYTNNMVKFTFVYPEPETDKRNVELGIEYLPISNYTINKLSNKTMKERSLIKQMRKITIDKKNERTN